jgi:hypothetical protein
MALNGVGDIVLTAVVRGLDGLISYWKSSTYGRSVVWIGIQRHCPRPLDFADPSTVLRMHFAREIGGWLG